MPHVTHQDPAFREFLCGWGAAAIETSLTFPLHKVIFRQQLYGIVGKEAIGQLTSEGIRHLFRGLLPPLIQKTSTRSLMFGMFEEYQRMLGCPALTDSNFSACHTAAAFLSGTTEALLVPLERVQALLQSQEYTGKFKHTMHALRSLRQYGYLEYYRGLTPILFRNGPSNILFFGLRDPLKSLFSGTSEQSDDSLARLQTFFANFISGAILGATLSTVFYPVNVVKTRMQTKLGGDFDSFFRTFQVIWRERDRSVRLLFRGVELNFSRSLITWGITNAVYEMLERYMSDRDSHSTSFWVWIQRGSS